MLTGVAHLVSSGYNGAVGVHSVVGGHPNRPADGQEEDPMAITERHQICPSTHRNAAPNADFARLLTDKVSISAARRTSIPARQP